MIASRFESSDVTLYHDDALAVLAQLPAQSVNLVVTDPPYMLGAASAGNLASKTGTWADMMNASHWFAAWYGEVGRVLRDDGAMWTFCNWRTVPVVVRAAMDARLPVTSLLVWDKERIGPGGPRGLRPRYEMVALLAKEGFAVPDRSTADVWAHRPEPRTTGHPAEKPLGLVERLIATSGIGANGTVLDPFAGSGTTLVAARRLGLSSIGIEADDRFVTTAAARLGLNPTAPPSPA